MMQTDFKGRILDLSQRWRMDLLNNDEKTELDSWFRSLEDTALGLPVEISVNRLERALHRLFWKDIKIDGDDENCPPYPFA